MEWIDIEVLNVFIKIGTIGLITGVISVLLTESVKITYGIVFSKVLPSVSDFWNE